MDHLGGGLLRVGSHAPPLPYTFIPTKGACAATNPFATGLPASCEPSSWPRGHLGSSPQGGQGGGFPQAAFEALGSGRSSLATSLDVSTSGLKGAPRSCRFLSCRV